MTMDQLINLLVTITLVELMVAIGLGVAIAGMIGVATAALAFGLFQTIVLALVALGWGQLTPATRCTPES